MSLVLDEIEACIPALRRYARALTREADRADDLVQDCLERAVRKRLLWRPGSSVRAWLFRILLNLYRNDLRRGRRAPAAVPIEGLAREPAEQPAQLHRLELADTARAIDALPAEQREALLLVALEGLSYAEAAHALDIPQGTLMSRIGRARNALRLRSTPAPTPRLRTVK